jgi:hypothetical protein
MDCRDFVSIAATLSGCVGQTPSPADFEFDS